MTCKTCGQEYLKKERVYAADVRASSEEYVDTQIATMKKHGSDPKLTPTRYRELVDSICEIISQSRGRATRPGGRCA